MAHQIVMEKLQQALDKESFEWMATHAPDLLGAIETEVAAGRKPEEIRLFVIRQTGRVELALRAEQAARAAAAAGR